MPTLPPATSSSTYSTSPTMSGPPQVFWQQLSTSVDHIIHQRLSELLSWLRTEHEGQSQRIVHCEETNKANVDRCAELTQSGLQLLCQRVLATDTKVNALAGAVDSLSKRLGGAPKDGEPATSLSDKIKDIEFTMGELLERVGDPLAAQELLGIPAVRHEVATSPMSPRASSTPPPAIVRHEMGVSPMKFASPPQLEDHELEDTLNALRPMTPISGTVARHRGGEDVRMRLTDTEEPAEDAAHGTCVLSSTLSPMVHPMPGAYAKAHGYTLPSRSLPRKAVQSHSAMPSPTPSARDPSATPAGQMHGADALHTGDAMDIDSRPAQGPGQPKEDARLMTPEATVRHSSLPMHMPVDDLADMTSDDPADLFDDAPPPSPQRTLSAQRRPLSLQQSFRTEEDQEAVNAYLLARSSPAPEAAYAGNGTSSRDSVPRSSGSQAGRVGYSNAIAGPSNMASVPSQQAGRSNNAGPNGNLAAGGDASDSELSSLSSLSDYDDADSTHPDRTECALSAAERSARGQAHLDNLDAVSASNASSAAQGRQGLRNPLLDLSGRPLVRYPVVKSEPPPSSRLSLPLKGKGKEKSAATTRVKRRRDNDAGPTQAKRARTEETGQSTKKSEKKRGGHKKLSAPQWPRKLDQSTFTKVECDTCHQWYHTGCVGLEEKGPITKTFCCPFCIANPKYKKTLTEIMENVCMRPDCERENEFEIDYVVGRFVKISSQTGKQTYYLVKWAPPWSIDSCTWQLSSDFAGEFIPRFLADAAREGKNCDGRTLVLLQEAEDCVRANPTVDWNRHDDIGNVLPMLDDDDTD